MRIKRLQLAAAWLPALLLAATALADPPKIGVYSGTFDPPHVGHEALVKAIKQKLGVDILYVIPNVTSDHKGGVQPYEVRKEMSEAAFGKIEGVKLPDAGLEKAFIEKDMTGVMEEILKRNPKGTQIFQVMGDDSFERFSQLKDKGKIPGRTIVVVPREGKVTVPAAVDGMPVQMLDTAGVEIPTVSSTKVRKAVGAGEATAELSEEVLEIVRRRKLYIPAFPPGSCANALEDLSGALTPK